MSPRYHFGTGRCPVCHRICALNANGRIQAHGPHAARCDGVGKNPAKEATGT